MLTRLPSAAPPLLSTTRRLNSQQLFSGDRAGGSSISRHSNALGKMFDLESTSRSDLVHQLAQLQRAIEELERGVHVAGKHGPLPLRSGTSGSQVTVGDSRDLQALYHDVSHDYLEYDDDFTRSNDHAIAHLIQQSYDEEDRRLALEIQELYYLPTFECKVCLDEHSEEDVAEVDGCWHRMCRDCMRGHVTSQLDARVYPIMCPICTADKDLDCPSALTNDLVEQLGLSEEEYAKFIDLEMSTFSISLTCFACNNSFLVDRDEFSQEKLITCPLPNCHKIWCKTCNQVLDDPKAEHTCDGSAELKRLVEEKKWKFCPGCNTPAEKISGCNHMTCLSPGCNVHFCYFCGATVCRSNIAKEISEAKQRHFSACTIFDEIPDVAVPP